MNTKMGDSSSSLGTFTDDYGEGDVSLQSYRSESCLSSSYNRISQEDANVLLQIRIAEYGTLTNDVGRYVSRSAKYTFVLGGGRKIDVNIRGDASTVVFSTVVHNLNHGDILRGAKKNNQRHGGSYSLMTLMMKHNATLARIAAHPNQRGHIGVYDGKFMLFGNAPVAVLSNKRRLDCILDDLLLKAIEISKDFANVEKSSKSKLFLRRNC